jgi:FtsZ-binding cell division protein ZapB
VDSLECDYNDLENIKDETIEELRDKNRDLEKENEELKRERDELKNKTIV